MKSNSKLKYNDRIALLPDEYKQVIQDIDEHMDTKKYDKAERRYHLQKVLKDMEEHILSEGTFDDFVSFNKNKFRIQKLDEFSKEHTSYIERTKIVNKIMNICLMTLVCYSFFMIALNAYFTNYLSTIWIAVLLAALTIACIIIKISLCKKARLARIYVYSDLIMYILITLICIMTSYYFMLFLWLYDICYIVYLQKRIVEKTV